MTPKEWLESIGSHSGDWIEDIENGGVYEVGELRGRRRNYLTLHPIKDGKRENAFTHLTIDNDGPNVGEWVRHKPATPKGQD